MKGIRAFVWAVMMLVWAVGVPAVAGSASLAATTAAPAAGQVPQAPRLDINKATKEELVAVPGIGPKMAQTILDLRAKLGGFTAVEDLLKVRGIGEKSLRRISPYLVVEPAGAAPPPASSVKQR